MSHVWVLSVKTSLPNTCNLKKEMTLTTTAYDSFEKARAALREVLKSYAFSENAMFDGDGRLIHFEEQIEDALPEEENADFEEGFLSQELLIYIADSLRAAFAGEDVKFEPLEDHYDDGCYFSVECGEGCFSLWGDFEGPCNGVTPTIHTNIFSMKEEKDYFLYLDDMFGQDDCSAELYVDLKRCEVQ